MLAPLTVATLSGLSSVWNKMVAKIPEISSPEIFIGFVAPIGADVQACVNDFAQIFDAFGYAVIEIKITDMFRRLKDFVPPKQELRDTPLFDRYKSYIAYGNQLRSDFEDDGFLAAMAIGSIVRNRRAIEVLHVRPRFERVVYLLHQFKPKEEIDLLRSLYGRLFFQVSVYSRRGARVANLAQNFAHSENSANINMYHARAEEIVQQDAEEQDIDHGQQVSKIFHDGDLIINMDIQQTPRIEQIRRFCSLLFGDNAISPNKNEYGMFIAKAAALRTLDLSRQVGAAIFSKEGEIISIGSNEVPKGLGGTYWSDDEFDDREYRRGRDSNDQRKKEILAEIVDILGYDIERVLENKAIQDSQFMDALEYGRIVHAEMSAISDAARLGRSVKGSVLYSTAFPCHMCAKHIVAAGIAKVVFWEPYPKSLVLDLHSDSIVIEGRDRGKFQNYPAVDFEHFFGISPRRYRELFERSKRKESDGRFRRWKNGRPRPSLGVSAPLFYTELEKSLFEDAVAKYIQDKGLSITVLDIPSVLRPE